MSTPPEAPSGVVTCRLIGDDCVTFERTDIGDYDVWLNPSWKEPELLSALCMLAEKRWFTGPCVYEFLRIAQRQLHLHLPLVSLSRCSHA